MANRQSAPRKPVERELGQPEIPRNEAPPELLRELVAHLRQNRTHLREEWLRRIAETRLLTAMTKEEIFAEATSVYDSYVEALETGTFEALQAYARNLSERIIPRGVETHEVIGIVLLLRDVLARSSLVPSSPNTRPILKSSIAFSMPTNPPRTALPTPLPSVSSKNANASSASSRKRFANSLRQSCRSANACSFFPSSVSLTHNELASSRSSCSAASAPIVQRSSSSTSPASPRWTSPSLTTSSKPSKLHAFSARPLSSQAFPQKLPRPSSPSVWISER